jgi:phage shock protein PspC (stress-responsive transcriptional regulator)
VISGVCKGLAAYFNVDVAIIRIIFMVLAFVTGGLWVLVYVAMMFVIPFATTSEQHAAAHGWPFNAQELVERAKAHYAEFRQNGGKWQRSRWRAQRRMWRSEQKRWKAERRHWKKYGGAMNGTPPPAPPPPPGWAAGQQPSPVMAVLSGFAGPIAAIVGVVLFFVFLSALLSMVMHHRIFGWWIPHGVPLWMGIVVLVLLYKAVSAPLEQARYASYYGPSTGQGWWFAMVGSLVWVGVLIFLGWLAWLHWDEVLTFMQQAGDMWRDMMDHRAAPPSDPGEASLLAWMIPSGALPGYLAARELQAHGKVDRPDVFGDATDGDEIDASLCDGAYGFERHAA